MVSSGFNPEFSDSSWSGAIRDALYLSNVFSRCLQMSAMQCVLQNMALLKSSVSNHSFSIRIIYVHVHNRDTLHGMLHAFMNTS